MVRMIDATSEAIYARGFRWKASASQVLTAIHLERQEDYNFLAPDAHFLEVKAVDQAIILGTLMDRAGDTRASVDYRFSQADRVFFKHFKAMADPTATIRDKLQAFSGTAGNALLYNAGGWHLCRDLVHRVKSWEYHKVRKICRMKRAPDEGRQAYNLRTAHLIRTWFEKSKVARLHHRLLQAVYKWAWEASHFFVGTQKQPLWDTIKTRSAQDWEEKHEGNAFIDPRNTTGWRHRKQGRVRAWETVFVEIFGLKWMDMLQTGRRQWIQSRRDFAAKISEEWGVQEAPTVHAIFAPAQVADIQFPQWQPEDFTWQAAHSCFELRMDSRILAEWINGVAKCWSSAYKPRLAVALEQLKRIVQGTGWKMRDAASDWAKWVPRQRNKLADRLANICMDRQANIAWRNPRPFPTEAILAQGYNLVITSDGGAAGGRAAAAWAIFAFGGQEPLVYAAGAIRLEDADSMEAEATGVELGVAALLLYTHGHPNVIPHAVDHWLQEDDLQI